jgi:hypothetical protein
VGLELLPLTLRPLHEPVEIDAGEAGIGRHRRPQGSPQHALRLDAGREPFELEQPAEVRVAGQASVELEQAHPLEQARSDELRRVLWGVEPPHDVHERPPVLLDLVHEIGESVAERARTVP